MFQNEYPDASDDCKFYQLTTIIVTPVMSPLPVLHEYYMCHHYPSATIFNFWMCASCPLILSHFNKQIIFISSPWHPLLNRLAMHGPLWRALLWESLLRNEIGKCYPKIIGRFFSFKNWYSTFLYVVIPFAPVTTLQFWTREDMETKPLIVLNNTVNFDTCHYISPFKWSTV